MKEEKKRVMKKTAYSSIEVLALGFEEIFHKLALIAPNASDLDRCFASGTNTTTHLRVNESALAPRHNTLSETLELAARIRGVGADFVAAYAFEPVVLLAFLLASWRRTDICGSWRFFTLK
jgi:hypothetical protein